MKKDVYCHRPHCKCVHTYSPVDENIAEVMGKYLHRGDSIWYDEYRSDLPIQAFSVFDEMGVVTEIGEDTLTVKLSETAQITLTKAEFVELFKPYSDINGPRDEDE